MIYDHVSVSPALRHLHPPRPRQRLEHPEQISSPVPLVLGVLARRRARPHGQRRSHVAEQLLATLVKADLRPLRVVRSGIHLQHLFHRRYKAGIGLGRQHPLLLQPRLEVVFLSVRQTVAGSMASTTSNSTSLSASSFIVQRAWPGGGGLHARATSRAS